MNVTQDPVVDRQATLHVEVDEELLERHLDRAYRKLVQRTNIPGFRRGKTPRRVFEQMIGRPVLVEEALETLVPDAVAKAIEQEDIKAYGTPSVSVVEHEPLPKFEVTVPLEPGVTVADYRSLQISEEPEPVTDEMVDAAIEEARQRQATWEPAERPLQIGDLGVITVNAQSGDEVVIQADNAEYLLQEGSMNPLPGFADAIVGMTSGQTREFTLTPPDDFPNSELAGKEIACKVDLFDVKAHIMPEVDDDLARSLGRGFETADEMRAGFRTELEEAAQTVARRRLQDRLIDELVETSEFEIPPLVIEHETQHVLEDQQQSLARYRVSMQDYMRNIGKSADEVVEEARASALLRLKRTLLVERIAEAEGVEVADEEITDEIERLLAGAGPQADRSALDSEETRSSVRSMLRRRKAIERLTEIVESKAGAGDSAVQEQDAQAAEPADEPESGDPEVEKSDVEEGKES